MISIICISKSKDLKNHHMKVASSLLVFSCRKHILWWHLKWLLRLKFTTLISILKLGMYAWTFFIQNGRRLLRLEMSFWHWYLCWRIHILTNHFCMMLVNSGKITKQRQLSLQSKIQSSMHPKMWKPEFKK